MNEVHHHEEINGVIYRLAKTEDDFKRLNDFWFIPFWRDELSAKSKGAYNGGKEQPKSVVESQMGILREGITIMAEDKLTGRLIGMMSNSLTCREDVEKEGEVTFEVLQEKYPPYHANMMYLLMSK